MRVVAAADANAVLPVVVVVVLHHLLLLVGCWCVASVYVYEHRRLSGILQAATRPQDVATDRGREREREREGTSAIGARSTVMGDAKRK